MSTITTPGGQTIEVIPDEEYVARGDLLGPKSLRTSWSKREPVLAALWLHGPYEDKSGRATLLLHEDARRRGYAGEPTAMLGVLGSFAPAIERDVRGKRTYRISLGAVLPSLWADRLTATYPRAAEPGPVAEEPPAPDEVTHFTPEPEPGPAWELEVTNAVALSLLTQVIEIVSSGGGSDDTTKRLREERDEARTRLHQQTEYAEKYRRQLRDVGEELAAVKHERDGLRKRLRLAEENLRKATSPDVQRQVDALVRAELDRVMRARPSGSHGPDAA